MKRKITAAAVAGSMLAGGAAGVGLFSGPGSNANAAGTAAPTTTTTAENPSASDQHGFSGHNEAVSDTSVAATAIGISETVLNTALTQGQSGRITQAQADAEKSTIDQRAIDRVNGTYGHDGPGFGHWFGGHNEAVSDASVAATAIGISETALTTALANGQTLAQIAKADNVDPQKVIDAFVADSQSELAAEVQSGRITQAQADAEKSVINQRATDQVNGTFGSDPHGAPDNGTPDPSSGPTA